MDMEGTFDVMSYMLTEHDKEVRKSRDEVLSTLWGAVGSGRLLPEYVREVENWLREHARESSLGMMRFVPTPKGEPQGSGHMLIGDEWVDQYGSGDSYSGTIAIKVGEVFLEVEFEM